MDQCGWQNGVTKFRCGLVSGSIGEADDMSLSISPNEVWWNVVLWTFGSWLDCCLKYAGLPLVNTNGALTRGLTERWLGFSWWCFRDSDSFRRCCGWWHVDGKHLSDEMSWSESLGTYWVCGFENQFPSVKLRGIFQVRILKVEPTDFRFRQFSLAR